jgi:hypothetical protein
VDSDTTNRDSLGRISIAHIHPMPHSKKRSGKTKNKIEEVPSLEAFRKFKAISVTDRE